MLRGLSQHQEGTAQVGGDNFVEQVEVILANGRQWHDARVVNHNVDAAEFRTGFIEEPLDVRRARHICLNGDGIAAHPLKFRHDFVSFRCVAQVVHNNRESILGQPLRHRPSDSTGCSGYNRNLLHHFPLYVLSLSDRAQYRLRAGTCNQSYGPYESAWDCQALLLVFFATSKCGYRQSLYKDSSRIPTLHSVVRPVRSLSEGF